MINESASLRSAGRIRDIVISWNACGFFVKYILLYRKTCLRRISSAPCRPPPSMQIFHIPAPPPPMWTGLENSIIANYFANEFCMSWCNYCNFLRGLLVVNTKQGCLAALAYKVFPQGGGHKVKVNGKGGGGGEGGGGRGWGMYDQEMQNLHQQSIIISTGNLKLSPPPPTPPLPKINLCNMH